MSAYSRQLKDLVSVGKATLQDFELLGIMSVSQLAQQDASLLYQKICTITGQRHDPCVEDVFAAAIAQAQDPNLPAERCKWWYWSQVRKKKALTTRASKSH